MSKLQLSRIVFGIAVVFSLVASGFAFAQGELSLGTKIRIVTQDTEVFDGVLSDKTPAGYLIRLSDGTTQHISYDDILTVKVLDDSPSSPTLPRETPSPATEADRDSSDREASSRRPSEGGYIPITIEQQELALDHKRRSFNNAAPGWIFFGTGMYFEFAGVIAEIAEGNICLDGCGGGLYYMAAAGTLCWGIGGLLVDTAGSLAHKSFLDLDIEYDTTVVARMGRVFFTVGWWTSAIGNILAIGSPSAIGGPASIIGTVIGFVGTLIMEVDRLNYLRKTDEALDRTVKVTRSRSFRLTPIAAASDSSGFIGVAGVW